MASRAAAIIPGISLLPPNTPTLYAPQTVPAHHFSLVGTNEAYPREHFPKVNSTFATIRRALCHLVAWYRKLDLNLHLLNPNVMQIACAGDRNASSIPSGQGMLRYRLVFPVEGLSIDKCTVVEHHGVADDVMRLAHRMSSPDSYFVTINLDHGYVQLFLTFPVAWIVFSK